MEAVWSGMPARNAVTAAAAALLLARALSAQATGRLSVEDPPPRSWALRLDGGLFSQGGPFDDIVPALGVSAGVEWQGRRSLFLRVLRHWEDPVLELGSDPMKRTVTALVFEVARWPSEPHTQQFRLRVGAGALWRGDLAVAPLALAGLAIRYEVADHFAFVGVIEDNIAWLKWQEAQACSPTGCTTIVWGGHTQHNPAGVVSLEWRP